MKSNITRDELIRLVEELVEQKRSGTLYVRTDDNHSIVIGIDAGEIVSLLAGARQGERAIPQIRKMVRGTCRLEDRAPPFARPGAGLASSGKLFSLVASDNSLAKDDDAPTDWVGDVLCSVLTGYLGPIAPVVCRDTISAAGGVDSLAKVRRVVDNLAAEIGNPHEAESFKAEVSKALS